MTDSTPNATPSLPRYFYSDPLAAAWMRWRYDMNFVTAEGDRLWLVAKDCTFYGYTHDKNKAQKISGAFPAYVHPDSLGLLGPQNHDVIVCSCGGELYRVNEYRDDSECDCSLAFARELLLNTAFHILRRDGRPFIWPEVATTGHLLTARTDATPAA